MTTTSYYVHTTKDADGDHEVHKTGCAWLPNPENRVYLGQFASCGPAVTAAKKTKYVPADGCKHCSEACHKT